MRTLRNSRMNPLASLIVRFLAIFVLVLVVLAAAWPVISPTYTKWIAGAARVGFHAVEAPNVSALEVRDGTLWIHRIVGPGQISPFTWFDRFTFFALVPLVALFAATPGLGWVRRMVRLSISLGLLFVIQAGYIVISVQLAYAAMGLSTVGAFVARTLEGWQVLVRVLWDAAPLALWIAFTAGVWSRRLRALRQDRKSTTRGVHHTGIAGLRTEARKGWES